MREKPGCDREVLKEGMSDSPQGLKGKRFEDCEQSEEKKWRSKRLRGGQRAGQRSMTSSTTSA